MSHLTSNGFRPPGRRGGRQHNGGGRDQADGRQARGVADVSTYRLLLWSGPQGWQGPASSHLELTGVGQAAQRRSSSSSAELT